MKRTELEQKILSRTQKSVLDTLLDRYEKSRTYRNENSVTQSFRAKPDEFFKDYDSDFVDIEEQAEFEHELEILKDNDFISLSRVNGIVTSVVLNTDKVEDIYRILNRTELKTFEKEQLQMYSNAIGKNPTLDAYCKAQIERIGQRKKAEHDVNDATALIKILKFIGENKEELYERELSIELFGDSKAFEENYRGKTISILKKYSDRLDSIDNITDEKEKGHILLAEYNIYPNPVYVYFKGPGVLSFEDGRNIELSDLTPLAINGSDIPRIVDIHVSASKIVTIENLTSFNRVKDKDSFFIYLAGYHNTTKQKFLKKISVLNTGKEWFHFGDIDPDGFCILEHLRRKTGIPFVPLHMSVQDLEKYRKYCKPLNNPSDKTKAETLIGRGLYTETLKYMLDNNIKLEQEVISYTEYKI